MCRTVRPIQLAAVRSWAMATSPRDLGNEPDHSTLKSKAAKEPHETLRYSLLGPSLTKSGQDNVDQQKVSTTVD